MCKAAEVGKIVINKCLRTGLFIDAQKLQKLLVLMQVECIKRSGKPLFKEDIRVWECGVAIKEVDEEFRDDGREITAYQTEYISLLEKEEESVNFTLNVYGNLDAPALNSLPVNQKVILLGALKSGHTVPHISPSILIGVFSEKE